MFTQGSDTLLAPSACVLSVGISSCNRWLSALYCFYWNFPGWAIPVLNIKCWFAHRRHGDLVSSISYISQYKYVIYKGKKNRDLGFKMKRCFNYDLSGILFPRRIFSLVFRARQIFHWWLGGGGLRNCQVSLKVVYVCTVNKYQ